jgi:hypothetical protein
MEPVPSMRAAQRITRSLIAGAMPVLTAAKCASEKFSLPQKKLVDTQNDRSYFTNQ